MALAASLIGLWPRGRRQKLSGPDERPGRQRGGRDEVPRVHDEAGLFVKRQVPELVVRRRDHDGVVARELLGGAWDRRETEVVVPPLARDGDVWVAVRD